MSAIADEFLRQLRTLTESWTTIALICSGVLNAILTGALLFKSALNEIATHRYKAWRERKERERQILLDLNERMRTFDSDYIMTWKDTQSN